MHRDFAEALSSGKLLSRFKESAGIADLLAEDLHKQLTMVARQQQDRAERLLQQERSEKSLLQEQIQSTQRQHEHIHSQCEEP